MMLFNVAPCAPFYDSVNGRRTNAKPPREIASAGAVRVHPPHFAHVVAGQRRGMMALAISPAHLGMHISHIVGMGADEKMARVDARRVVATVADLHTGRHGASVGNLPGHPMRAVVTAPGTLEKTVSGWTASAKPRPALIRPASVYLAPKAIFEADRPRNPALLVVDDVMAGLPFDVSPLRLGAVGDLGGLAASAVAQAVTVGPVGVKIANSGECGTIGIKHRKALSGGTGSVSALPGRFVAPNYSRNGSRI